MKLKFIIAAAFAAIVGSAEALVPIPMDSAVHTGTLPNGLTYYIRHNDWPANRADFFIAQRVGSVQEEENQRGLAHFLEHMCFNGTRHFPGNSLINYLESIGVKFGANLNAYTSTDETVYNICDVPTQRISALDSCMLILRDWSGDLLLDEKDIDEERGVIKGEWRQRNSASNSRLLEKAAPHIYPGSRYGNRMPIGLMSVVENFHPDALRAYYAKWYHPQNQCIIIVGDIDPARTEQQLHKLWADMPARKDAALPEPEIIPANKNVIATVQTDPEQSSSMVMIYAKHGDTPKHAVGTVGELRRDLTRSLVSQMLADRYDLVESEPEAPFTNLGIGDMKFLLASTQQALTVRATSKPGREAETATSIAKELKRAAMQGFTQTELDRAKASESANFDADYTARRTNTEFAREYVRHYLDGGKNALPSAEARYKMLKGIIRSVTLDSVNAYISEVIKPDNSNIVAVAYMPEKAAKLTDEQLARAYAGVDGSALPEYRDPETATHLLSHEPKEGTIVSTDSISEFDTKVLTLSNGIKVYLKHTDFTPGKVLIQGFCPGGLSVDYNQELAPEYRLVNDALAVSGYGTHNSTDLKRMVAGKNVKTAVAIENMEHTLGASADTANLTTAMQLLYLKATAPARDDRAFNAMIENQRSKLSSHDSNPTFAMGDSIHLYVYNRHPLGAKLNAADLDKVSYDRIIGLHNKLFSDMSDFTFNIVGDFNPDTITDLVCRYIASLPGGERHLSAHDIGYRYAQGIQNHKFTMPMSTPQTISYTFYNAPCEYNAANTVLAHATGSILQSKLRDDLREKRGWTYGVKSHCGVSDGMNGADPARAIIPVYIRVEPQNADSCFAIVDATARAMAKPGYVSADEVNKVKQFLEKAWEDNGKSNDYWHTVLKMYRKFGVDMHTTFPEHIRALTPEKVAAFAEKVILPASRLHLEMAPE